MRTIRLSSWLLASALAIAADDPAPFEANAAREDITPPSGLQQLFSFGYANGYHQ